jgi:HlyD family secretion protein
MATKLRPLLVTSAILLVLAVGMLPVWLAPAVSQVPAEKTPPAVERAVVALGLIEPVSGVVHVAAPSSSENGRLASVFVAEGDWVGAGQPLAEFDTKPRLEARLAQAKAQLEQSKAQLFKTVANLENQSAVLAATVKQKKADRDRAAWEFDRQSRLKQAGLYNEASLIERRLTLESAEAQLTQAQMQLERADLRTGDNSRLDEVELQAAIASAEAAVSSAAADLAQATLRAPIAGRVLTLHAKAGERIGSDGLAALADTRMMRVRAEVLEEDVLMVFPGDVVEVSSRSIQGTVTGTVERIGLRVERQSIVGDDAASREDARVVEVIIRLGARSSALVADRTGLQVRCRFLPRRVS